MLFCRNVGWSAAPESHFILGTLDQDFHLICQIYQNIATYENHSWKTNKDPCLQVSHHVAARAVTLIPSQCPDLNPRQIAQVVRNVVQVQEFSWRASETFLSFLIVSHDPSVFVWVNDQHQATLLSMITLSVLTNERIDIELVAELATDDSWLELSTDWEREALHVLTQHLQVSGEGTEWNQGRGRDVVISVHQVDWMVAHHRLGGVRFWGMSYSYNRSEGTLNFHRMSQQWSLRDI